MLTKLAAYSGRDLQNFASLLNSFEGGGVTDYRIIRQEINNEQRRRAMSTRVSAPKQTRIQKGEPPTNSVCPKCGSVLWRPSQDVDGVWYTLCKDCQYSELLGSE